MPVITFQGAQYTCHGNETVTDCLERHGVSVATSCRSGICQTCLMRAVSGQPPYVAQKGLKPSLQDNNYFLPCVCTPTGDLTVALPGDKVLQRIPATVILKDHLNTGIIRLRLRPEQPFEFRAGQFINVCRETDGEVRSYSIASLPQYHEAIEIHVRRVSNGRVSTWLHDHVLPGERLLIEGPHGECCYMPDNRQQGLLLIGTGCGLSPLYGVLRDALDHGHAGPILLFHGSSSHDGLYLVDELRHLAEAHANFRYIPCVSAEPARTGYAGGRAEQVALQSVKSLAGMRVYLCGHPDMVKDTKRKAFLAGASLQEIHADPFITTHKTPLIDKQATAG